MCTTVQDLGRPGWASVGVARGGAADALSLRIGNRLLQNEDRAAAIEMTLLGGAFACERDIIAVLAGGEIEARIEGRGSTHLASTWAPFELSAGERLVTRSIRGGVRTILCVAGGILVPPLLGSRSTHLGGQFGGLDGRMLRPGDAIEVGEPRGRCADGSAGARARALAKPMLARRSLRAVDGPHRHCFDSAAVKRFWSTRFEVSLQSDRVGLRLNECIGSANFGGRMPSEGMLHGAVQVPESGRPIVLMADHPTTGGYPVVACVAAVDLPALGQVRPGESISFETVTVERARELYAERERILEVELPTR
ncbi:MAG: biotin-dependent carboxyltransferase family protein [Planctomycetes bacterium]|nr:biotin-dependent carboxyltransferase family protein [Planctomycetota bacterium]